LFTNALVGGEDSRSRNSLSSVKSVLKLSNPTQSTICSLAFVSPKLRMTV
jgi:hypothetical protein